MIKPYVELQDIRRKVYIKAKPKKVIEMLQL